MDTTTEQLKALMFSPAVRSHTEWDDTRFYVVALLVGLRGTGKTMPETSLAGRRGWSPLMNPDAPPQAEERGHHADAEVLEELFFQDSPEVMGGRRSMGGLTGHPRCQRFPDRSGSNLGGVSRVARYRMIRS